MSENRLAVLLDQFRRASLDACSFLDGMSKEEFLVDERTQNAVIAEIRSEDAK